MFSSANPTLALLMWGEDDGTPPVLTNSQFPYRLAACTARILNSQFSIHDSRLTILNSQFPLRQTTPPF
ncbi:MAG: hypothetical protein NC421_04985 [Lachnospiraceae bacterium]|nr:hypothetical protein [Lachnospiraceae bacterium]